MQDATQSPFKVNLVPAFDDNYIFVLEHTRSQTCIIIDAGEFEGVERFVQSRQLQPIAVINTHHHHDHTGANAYFQQHYNLAVYAPHEPRAPISDTQLLKEGAFTVGRFSFQVIHTPGHTLGHVSLFHEPTFSLFCGDVLFVLGCGRVFEGTMAQSFTSLCRLAELPPHTQIYCAHEYTQKNLQFTDHHSFNADLDGWTDYALELRRQARTVPTLMADQLRFNPFMNFKFNPQHSLAHQSENDAVKEFERRRHLRNQY